MTQDEEKKFTQTDIDRIIGERLARDRDVRGGADAIEMLAQLKRDLAEEKAKREALEAKDATNALEALKAKVASELKLPSTLVQFVQGTDEATVKQSVEALLTGIGPGPSVGGATNPAGGNTSPKVYTKAELEGMSPDAINKDWPNIQKQLSSGLIK